MFVSKTPFANCYSLAFPGQLGYNSGNWHVWEIAAKKKGIAMPIALTQLDMDQVLRYMGCPPDKADAATRRLVEECAAQLLPQLRPRWAYRVRGLALEEQGVRLADGLLLPGQDLKNHLCGCERAALFCATLGAETDAMILRAQSQDMARALALDCCATAAVEQVCDQIQQRLQALFPACFFPFRFSPGYGDLPLSIQPSLLQLLDAPRRVGLCANENHILIPRKSVTAILGVARQPIERSVRSCLGCPAYEKCQYRSAGGHCGIS
jgi:hypothetical protein